jgi:hypothetical protein
MGVGKPKYSKYVPIKQDYVTMALLAEYRKGDKYSGLLTNLQDTLTYGKVNVINSLEM